MRLIYLAFLISLPLISHANKLTDKQYIQALNYFSNQRITPLMIIQKGDAGNPDPLEIPKAFCEVLDSLKQEIKFAKSHPDKNHLLSGSYFIELEKGMKVSNFMLKEYGKHGFKCSSYFPLMG